MKSKEERRQSGKCRIQVETGRESSIPLVRNASQSRGSCKINLRDSYLEAISVGF